MNNGGVHMSEEGQKPKEQLSRSDFHGSENQASVPAEEIRLKVEDLSIFYGDFRAVKDVNMSVKTNHVTSIIGPSGCGKSTFIRCLNRMHEVTPGGRVQGKVLSTVRIFTAPVSTRSTCAGGLAWFSRKPMFFPACRSMTMWHSAIA